MKPVLIEFVWIKKKHICGAKFTTKTGYCEAVGKIGYNGFCGKHINSNINDKNIPSAPIVQTTITTDKIICGMKFKTKEGICTSLGKYNGLCGLHAKCNTNFTVV